MNIFLCDKTIGIARRSQVFSLSGSIVACGAR